MYEFSVSVQNGRYHMVGVAPEDCCAGVNTYHSSADLYSHTASWNKDGSPFLGTSGIRALVVRQSRTPQPIADSLSAPPWAATVVSQGRLGSGSRMLASSLGETTRTSVQERLVGHARQPLALTKWRHPPSIRRARALSTPLRHSLSVMVKQHMDGHLPDSRSCWTPVWTASMLLTA